MDKKRSKGVTFWAWICIISGIIGIRGILNPQLTVKYFGIILYIISSISSILYLVTGVFLLKLKEFARKATIILGIVSIVLIPFYFTPLIIKNHISYYEKQKQYIIENVKPEKQQIELKKLEKIQNTAKDVGPILIMIFFGVPIIIFELLPIIFFTRPKIKAQFRIQGTHT